MMDSNSAPCRPAIDPKVTFPLPGKYFTIRLMDLWRTSIKRRQKRIEKTDGKSRLNRRKLLKAAGVTLAAGALSCAGLTYFATQGTRVDFSTFRCAEDTNMGDRILVAYASKYGSTSEVAEAVGKILCQAGAAVDVKKAKDVNDISQYRAVVLGTALLMEKPLSDALNFAKKYRTTLAGLPMAIFCVGLTMKEDTPENRGKAKQLMAPLLNEIPAPVSLGFFGGKVDYKKLGPIMGFFFSLDKSGEMAEGDWRDWGAIRGWAEELAPLL
jgi:menaquinone-dependent protoporphyrinogen oxidase